MAQTYQEFASENLAQFGWQMAAGDIDAVAWYYDNSGNTTQKIVWEKQHKIAPSPRTYNPNITPELELIIKRCLDKSPKKRYQTALDFAKALEDATSTLGLRSEYGATPIAGFAQIAVYE